MFIVRACRTTPAITLSLLNLFPKNYTKDMENQENLGRTPPKKELITAVSKVVELYLRGLLNNSNEFFIHEAAFTPEQRIQTYRQRFSVYKNRFPSCNENDFIEKELKESKQTLGKAGTSDTVRGNAYYNNKRYVEHLEKLQLERKEEEKQVADLDKSKVFLRTTLNRAKTVCLFAALKDAGIIDPSMSDYRLAKFLEQSVHSELDKPLKTVSVEISKQRHRDVNVDHLLAEIRESLANLELRDGE